MQFDNAMHIPGSCEPFEMAITWHSTFAQLHSLRTMMENREFAFTLRYSIIDFFQYWKTAWNVAVTHSTFIIHRSYRRENVYDIIIMYSVRMLIEPVWNRNVCTIGVLSEVKFLPFSYKRINVCKKQTQSMDAIIVRIYLFYMRIRVKWAL